MYKRQALLFSLQNRDRSSGRSPLIPNNLAPDVYKRQGYGRYGGFADAGHHDGVRQPYGDCQELLDDQRQDQVKKSFIGKVYF